MLGMLHALPAARAPLGFVDRVLEAARPTPWYARLGRRILQPWRVKLPLEAAALSWWRSGAVYVFQKTPELQQAARYEAPAPSPARRSVQPRRRPPPARLPRPLPSRRAGSKAGRAPGAGASLSAGARRRAAGRGAPYATRLRRRSWNRPGRRAMPRPRRRKRETRPGRT